jgi:hypothetical protein
MLDPFENGEVIPIESFALFENSELGTFFEGFDDGSNDRVHLKWNYKESEANPAHA